MTVDLRGRDLLREADLSAAELQHLLDLAADLKAQRRAGVRDPRLVGRVIALIFEKTSTRTRCAFEVGAYLEGAHVTFLDPSSSQLGHKESVADTARVLAGMFDAIQFRGSAHETVEALAAASDVPVYNGLTDTWHPTQMLADFLTMKEHSAALSQPGSGTAWSQVSYAYLGDARNNMGNSLLVMGAIMGVDVRFAAPRALWPAEEIQELARARAGASGARILLTEDPREAVSGAEFVHTDVWVSMGEEPSVWEARVDLLRPYRVDAGLMSATGRESRFMHCLPAFHDTSTAVGAQAAERFGMDDGLEVSHEVFSSSSSIVFEQSANRMHTIRALLVATLAS